MFKLTSNTWKFLLSMVFIIPMVFTTCEMPLGMGSPIDFEPPELRLTNVKNPMYVTSGATITGTVWDNVNVDEVICRETATDRVLGRANLSLEERTSDGVTYSWTITIEFKDYRLYEGAAPDTWECPYPCNQINIIKDVKNIGNEECTKCKKQGIFDNNRKIAAEVIAFDKMRNSGEESIQFINFIVDMQPPYFENPIIQRSPSRSAPLRSYDFLNGLNYNDRDERIKGYERIQNVDLYQNGVFWITTDVIERETVTETVILYLYDYERQNEGDHIYRAMFDSGNPFAPRWTLNEKTIAAGGDIKGLDYSGKLARGEDIYLRVMLEAKDLADNTGASSIGDRRFDFDFICINSFADIPKALTAGGIGSVIPPKTEIPLDVFDDDAIDLVYADLIRIERYREYQLTYGNNYREKIREDIINGSLTNWQNNAFTERRKVVSPNSNPESFTVLVKTGETPADCGEFMLIAIVKDIKKSPHKPEDLTDTLSQPVWSFSAYDFTIVDENSAVIVIDTVDTSQLTAAYLTCSNSGGIHEHNCNHLGHDLGNPAWSTGNSPEESTFPALTDGKYFTISGYTLNETTPEVQGSVSQFKIAWIPHAYVIQVGYQTAIDNTREFLSEKISLPAGSNIQYWNMHEHTDITKNSFFVTGTPQEVGNATFTKQTFKKRFNILGDTDDDLKDEYQNFTRIKGNPSTFENEDKYFVLYAKNSNSNETFRTIRLLGNKNPPALRVYDLSKLQPLDTWTPAEKTAWEALDNQIKNAASINYDNNPLLNDYNTHYNIIRNAARSLGEALEEYRAPAFTAFPPGLVYKLYVMADEERGVAIRSFNMVDSSIALDPKLVGSVPNLQNKDLVFFMPLTDLALKVFNFRANNMLEIHGQVQRTIAVTNTAQLSAIVTSTPAGSYQGFGNIITLRAQFTAPVRVRAAAGTGNRPLLNVRYETDGKGSNVWKYTTVPLNVGSGTASDGSIYLDFDFVVPDDAYGRLQTVDFGYGEATQFTHDRPIYLNGAQILDAEREDSVFLPGRGESGYLIEWEFNKGNLQGTPGNPDDGKEILLDGIVPVITHAEPYGNGKQHYSKDNGKGNPFTAPVTSVRARWYYYNSDDSIEIEIRASKGIQNRNIPKIGFKIQEANGTLRPNAAAQITEANYYFAEYIRPTTGGLLFAIDVIDLPTGTNGFITNLVVLTDDDNKIVDTSGGNELNPDDILDVFNSNNYILVVDRLRPGFQIPATPVTPMPLLNGAAPATEYGATPILTIIGLANTSSAQEPWGSFAQYSLDGGLTWVNYPNFQSGLFSLDGGLTWVPSFPDNDPEWFNQSWTTYTSGTLRINPGEWQLQTRQIDKAGNSSLLSPVYPIEIEDNFPRLLSITTRQGRGVYKAGDTLEFILDFERPVRTINTNAHIIVSDRIANNTLTANKETIQIPVVSQAALSSSLSFTWNLTENTKNMPYGITITRINLTGVRDNFGNTGESLGIINTPNRFDYPGQPAEPGTNEIRPGNSVNNLNGRQTEVYTFKPVLEEDECIPRSGHIPGNSTGGFATNSPEGRAIILDEASRNVIRLKFSHPIRKEMGKIFIKPYGSYPVPPVFPAEGYMDADGTYVEGFLEILNSSNIDEYAATAGITAETLRNYLYATGFVNTSGDIVSGGTAAAPPAGSLTDINGKLLTTGLDFGPYKLTTQGLIQGNGYTGSNTIGSTPPATTGYNHLTSGWDPVPDSSGADTSRFMIPDTSSKYVLDFDLIATDTAATGRVANIRTALNAAKFRWREIDVNSSNIKIYRDGFPANPAQAANTATMGEYVVIELDTKLAKGFRWEVQWEEGVFVDNAGNQAAAYGLELSGYNHIANGNLTTAPVGLQVGSHIRNISGATRTIGDVSVLNERFVRITALTPFACELVPFAEERQHWFWTEGVQPPVIRVNRTSMDYRSTARRWGGGNDGNTRGDIPRFSANTGTNGATLISSFDTVSYRIESETPGATIRHTTILGRSQMSGDFADRTHNYGAIEAAWADDNMILPSLFENNAAAALTAAPTGARVGDYIRNTNATQRAFGSAAPAGNQIQVPANGLVQIRNLTNPFTCVAITPAQLAANDRLIFAHTAAANITTVPSGLRVNDYIQNRSGAARTIGNLTGVANNAYVRITATTPLTCATATTGEVTQELQWTSTEETTGKWVLPNLLRRAISGATGGIDNNTRETDPGLIYNVTRNNVTSLITGRGSYRGFRSFNRDATVNQLQGLANGLTAGGTTGSIQSSINIAGSGASSPELRASKNYVVARAVISNGGDNHTANGYEGIFKTVIVINNPWTGGSKLFSNAQGDGTKVLYGGNNIGSSSIAGFPLLPATSDFRYLKVPFTNYGQELYWVSTEIVSPLFVSFGSPQNNSDFNAVAPNASGDTGRFISGSYGDLSYARDFDQVF